MRRLIFLALFFPLSVGLSVIPGCSRSEPVWPNKPGKKVLTTFAPIYCLTQTIAGDDANVMCLLTASGPHNAETDTQDVMKVAGADLILANGLGLDDVVLTKLINSSSKKIKTVYVGNELDKTHHELLIDADHDEEEPDEDKHKGHDHHAGHHHGAHDPHIWLSPDLARLMVDIIADQLCTLDSSKKDNFRKRAETLKSEITKLKEYGLDKFKDKKNRNIVTQHDSLAYFARDFKLNIVGHIRSQKGVDEGGKDKLIVSLKTKEKRPSVLTLEPRQFDHREVEAMQANLKKEGIDTAIAEVDPIETAVGTANPEPGYYLEKMRENIDNLAKALP